MESLSSFRKIISEKKVWQITPYTWAVIELMVGGVTMYLAYQLTPASLGTAAERHLPMREAVILYSVLLTLSAHAIGLHNNLNLHSRARIAIMSVANVGLTMATLAFIISFLLYGQIGRFILVICASLTVTIGTALRLAVHRSIHASPLRVWVAGDTHLTEFLSELVAENPGRLIVSSHPSHDLHYDVIVIPESKLECTADIAPFLRLADQGIPIFTAAAFMESHFYRIPAQYVSAGWLFAIDLQRLNPFYHEFKRILDVCLSGLGLIISAPLILLVAIAIRLESPGPIFYSQVRVGLFQHPFRIWKLRTMRDDAEKSGPQWASVGDARVTFIGRVLRKTRIDELPQFWNILRGDMAFVGPRPERPEFVEQLAMEIPYYRQRHLVKPGLTGWAQICYPYGASTKDAWNKLSYDFYYMKNLSLTLDLQILLQTIGAAARGSR